MIVQDALDRMQEVMSANGCHVASPDEAVKVVAPGHRVMIQVQSTWFPFIDRNPQKFVANIFEAKEADFIKATHRLFHSPVHPSRIEFSVLPPIHGQASR